MRAALSMLLLAAGLATAACGSSATTNITGPTATKCQVTLSNSASDLPSSGGSATLTVNSERECSWSASSNAAWVTLAATSGQGPGTIAYSVQPNPNGTSRQAQVVVANQSVDILQDAAPCKYSLEPARAAVGASSSDVSFTLTATAGCHWTSTSGVDWIAPASPSSGTGNATVHFTVALNTAAARAGSVKIGDAQATVQQAAASGPTPQPPSPPPAPPPPAPPPEPPPGCTFAVSPLTASVPAVGGEVHAAVTAAAGCAWTTASTVPWITITVGMTGSGSGEMVALVVPNTGPARTGTISIAGQTVTITQDALIGPACTYQLTPGSVDLTSDAQDTTVAVAAGDGCQWKPASDVPWITVADPGSGAANGSFKLTIGANTADARTGTVQVGTATFTVRQAAGSTCTYAIAPTSYDAIRDADAVDVAVTAGPTCAWTTMTDATWVTIAAGVSGTGNGTVHLAIDANPGSARSALVTIAGQPFTIRQSGVCTYAIKPDFYNAGKGPDNISVNVTADAGCTWTASSPVTWATISQGATGTGNGVVKIAVDPNGGSNRAATLTIAGLPFQLTQKGRE